MNTFQYSEAYHAHKPDLAGALGTQPARDRVVGQSRDLIKGEVRFVRLIHFDTCAVNKCIPSVPTDRLDSFSLKITSASPFLMMAMERTERLPSTMHPRTDFLLRSP